MKKNRRKNYLKATNIKNNNIPKADRVGIRLTQKVAEGVARVVEKHSL